MIHRNFFVWLLVLGGLSGCALPMSRQQPPAPVVRATPPPVPVRPVPAPAAPVAAAPSARVYAYAPQDEPPLEELPSERPAPAVAERMPSERGLPMGDEPAVPSSTAPRPAPPPAAPVAPSPPRPAPAAPVSPPAPRPAVASAPVSVVAPPSLPPAVESLVRQAEQQRQSGDHAGAAAALERALRLQPQQAYLWNRLARVRLEQGLAVQAANLAERSNTLAGDQPALKRDNWSIVATARRQQGDAAGALEAERRAGGG